MYPDYLSPVQRIRPTSPGPVAARPVVRPMDVTTNVAALPRGQVPLGPVPRGPVTMGPPAPIHDAIERLAQAIRAQQTLQTQRDLAPLGLEIDAQIAAQAAAIDALQTELTASLAEARLAEAREVTPDSDRDLFAEQTARYLAGSVDPAAQSAWEQAVADSVDLALATEAGTLEEA